MRRDLDRRLKKLEAVSGVERFDSIGIVCIGMGTAEDYEPAANEDMPALEKEDYEPAANEDMPALEKEDHEPAADEDMPALEIEDRELAAEEDMLAKEMGNPTPIPVKEIIAEETEDRVPAADEEWVDDWWVEADGRVSKITKRICSGPSDWGRNCRRDAMGKMFEDLGLERRVTKRGRGFIIWVATKPGTKPFPTKVGTRVLRYASA